MFFLKNEDYLYINGLITLYSAAGLFVAPI